MRIAIWQTGKPPVNLLLTWDYAAKIDKLSRHADVLSK